MGDWTRALTAHEQDQIDAARHTAHQLYDGVVTPHRSCGIAMAETFGRATPAYQALRRGGLTGCGPCGVAQGGRMILGEVFGDPDPTGPVTDALSAAMADYEARLPEAMARPVGDALVCNDLTARFAEFRGPDRHAYCTGLASRVAALLAEVIVRNGGTWPPGDESP